MHDKPIAYDAYEVLAEAYAAHIDTKPHNAYYERPATLSLLPEVNGKNVLDAGCGPGVYSEWLLARCAIVVALDASPKMVALAKKRLGAQADVRVADLRNGFPFLESASFDVVLSPLVLDYIEDWRPVLAEFNRLLRADGRLVFSVAHPFFDFTYHKSDDYFATERVSAEWRGFHPVRVQMPCFRRSLAEVINPLIESGFQVETILEPKPTPEFELADPKHYAELSRQPCFIFIRARKKSVY